MIFIKIIISYDIVENKRREEIIMTLQNYGFIRVQKSVFLGEIDKNKLSKIVLDLSEIIIEQKDSLCILRICEGCYNRGIFSSKDSSYKIISEEFLLL
ncbi:MAG: CRISPR-associated endonuclease Cas2 [Fusobacteriaceae bacterium]